jgi:hypothetical protein
VDDDNEVGRAWQWGYRLSNNQEVWSKDHGSDGVWIPSDQTVGIEAIDLWPGAESAAIYRALDGARADGVALRRLVTHHHHEPEIAPRS